MDVSVVVVGDEILSGFVQDANTHFIATRLATHGHRLRRAAVVQDDPGDIALEIERQLSASDMIVVCGGLGPTHDDRTMQGVARALGVSLEPCAVLRDRIEELIARASSQGFTDSFGIEGLRKMALAPAGAEFLSFEGGWVLAVTIADPRARIVVLPGPPLELQEVFIAAVEPRYLDGTGEVLAREELTHHFPESSLAALLAELQGRFPRTSIGSYPQAGHVLVRISGPAGDARAVRDAIAVYLEGMTASDEGRRLLSLRRKR